MALYDSRWESRGAVCLLVTMPAAIKAADRIARRAVARGELPHHMAHRYCRMAYQTGDARRHQYWAEVYVILCSRRRAEKQGGPLFLVIDRQRVMD